MEIRAQVTFSYAAIWKQGRCLTLAQLDSIDDNYLGIDLKSFILQPNLQC